jgi:hypothetical protein
METVRTSETSAYFYETARVYIPEGCHLYTRRRNNLKSHSLGSVHVYLISIRMTSLVFSFNVIVGSCFT